jgi:hypothetical protein
MFPEGFLTSATLGRAIRLVGLLLACSVFVIGLSLSASADTVYTYMGHPFDSFTGVAACPPECSISGSFTLPSPLPINLALSAITPISFSFTDGSAVRG